MAEVKQVQAIAKGVRIPPRKVGLVASLVRGRSVSDALTILQHTPKRAAVPVSKAIASAKANAINNHRVDENSLVVSSLQVTSGPRLKRFRPVARGMAQPYQKQTSHIYVQVTGTEKPRKTSAKQTATKEDK
jgi:large subunit ribosomal protein L22